MQLKIVFTTDTENTHIHTLNDVREDITSSDVDAYCTSVLGMDVIGPAKGSKVVSVSSRETIVTTVTSI